MRERDSIWVATFVFALIIVIGIMVAVFDPDFVTSTPRCQVNGPHDPAIVYTCGKP